MDSRRPRHRGAGADPSAELPEPAGFALLLRIVNDSGNYNGSTTLYVPTGLATRINAARERLGECSDDRKAWERACARREEPFSEIDDRADADPFTASLPETNPFSLQNRPASRPVAATPAVAVPPVRRKPRPTRNGRPTLVISAADITARRADAETRVKFSTQEKKAEQKVMDDLLARGEYRMVGLKRGWQAQLARLRSDMPNFSAVVDRIEACCALADFGRTPVRIPPLLLVGSPGVGKTHFALRLADVLGVAQFVYQLESAETVSSLCGSDKHWWNTEPGALHRLILLGTHANPVVVLDEIDKANRGSSYKPANALHAVLEPATARQLRDKSVDLPFDASYVVYIATANRLSLIDDSLLSRFQLFFIDEPGVRAAVSIARAICRQVLGELKLSGRFEMPAGEVVQQVALLGGPRRMRMVIEAAFGRAVIAGRTRVTVRDLLSGEAARPDGEDSDVHTN